MPFTTQDFLKSTAQAKPLQPSDSYGNDGRLKQSSAISPSLSSELSSSVFSSISMSNLLPTLETAQQAECRTSCLHRSCRTFRASQVEAISEDGFPHPIALNYLFINHIYYLHEKLGDLQAGVDAAEHLIQLCRARILKFHPMEIQNHVHITSLRRKELEELLTQIRSRNAYFGHIDLPGRLNFIEAVETSGLTQGQVPLQQLLSWNDFAEDCRRDYRNNAEYLVETGNYDRRRDMGFDGWNFETAFVRGGGSAVDEEEIAPDEPSPEKRGTKRVRSKVSAIPDEKVARMKARAEGLLAKD
ncbi:hypothetical protein PMIN02_010867 [Paraphaeosphaeria minitans]